MARRSHSFGSQAAHARSAYNVGHHVPNHAVMPGVSETPNQNLDTGKVESCTVNGRTKVET